MAQSPDNKPTSSNAGASQSDIERKAQAAASQTWEGERNVASAAQTTTRHGGAIAQQGMQQASETVRRGGAAQAELAQLGAQIGTETTRRSVDATTQAYRQLIEGIAKRYEAVGRRMGQSLQENASDIRTVLVPPEAATNSLRDLQEGMARLVDGVVQSNVRATQQLFRIADPTALFDLQSQFIRDYLDTLLQGSSALIRVTRQTAEQALRPIEARIEARQNQPQGEPQSQARKQSDGVVADVMSANVRMVNPDDTVQQASRLMREEDTGVLPVGEGDRLVGVVTDRDITLRLVAEGKDPARTKVREVMTQDVKYAFEDEDLDHVADNMAEQQLRRLPVVNRAKRLVGVVSLGDLARGSRSGHLAGQAMRGVARESGEQMSSAAE